MLRRIYIAFRESLGELLHPISWRTWTLLGTGALGVFMLTIFLLVYSVRVRSTFVRIGQAAVARQTGLRVQVGDFGVSLFPPQLSLSNVQVSRLGGKPFFSAAQINFLPGITRSLSGRLALDWIELRSPDIHLTYRDGGFEELGALAPRQGDKGPMEVNIPFELWGALLTRGHVRIDVPGHAIIDIDGLNVFAAPRATGSIPIDIVVPPIVIQLPTRRVILKDIGLGLNVMGGNLLAPKVVTVSRLEFISDAGSIRTAGDVDMQNRRGAMKVQSNVDLHLLNAIFPAWPALNGRVAVSAQLRAAEENPELRLEIDGVDLAVDHKNIGTLHAEIVAQRKNIAIDKLTIRGASGEAVIKGQIAPTNDLPAFFDVSWTGLELAEIIDTAGLKDPWVMLRSNGKAKLSGHLKPKNVADNLLTGPVHIDVQTFTSRDRSFRLGEYRTFVELKNATIDGKIAFFSERIELTDTYVKGEPGEIHLDARFYFQQALGFLIRGESDLLDLDKFGHIGGIAIGGAGPLHFELGGPYGPPNIDAQVSFGGASVAGIPLGTLDSRILFRDHHTLEFSDALATYNETEVEAEAALDFDKGPTLNVTGRIEDGDIRDLLPLIPLPDLLAEALHGRASGEFKIRGLAATPDLEATFSSPQFETIGQPFTRTTGHVKLTHGQFDELEMTAQLGEGKVDLTLSGPPNMLSIEAQLDNIPVSELRFLQAAREALTGTLNGNVAAQLGKVQMGHADFMVDDLKIAGRQAQQIKGALMLTGNRITYKASTLEGAAKVEGSADLSGRPNFILDANIAQANIGGLLGTPDDYKVIASGELHLAGPFDSIDQLTGKLALEQLSLDSSQVSAVSKARTDFALANKKISFSDFELQGEGVELNLLGQVGIDGKLNISVGGHFDGGLLKPFIPTVETLQGDIPLDVRLGGSLSSLDFRGAAKLSDLVLKFSFLDMPLENLSGTLTLTGDAFVFDDLQAYYGDGKVTAQGNARLGTKESDDDDSDAVRRGLQSLSFQVDLQDVAYVAPGDLPMTLGGRIAVDTNNKGQFDITGDVRVVELRYTRDLSMGPLLLSFGRKSSQSRTLLKRDEVVNFDVGVRAENNIIVDNNLAKAEFRADLRLTGTNLRIGLLGSLVPLRAQFFHQSMVFTMTSGTIDFVEQYAIVPRADLRLTTKACGADISVTISGTADSPQIEARGRDINGPLSAEDATGCLLVGVRQSDLYASNNASQGVPGAGINEALIGTTLSTVTGLDQRLKKLLPVIDQLRFSSGYSNRERRSTLRLIVEKQLIEGITLRLNSSLTTGDNQKIEMEMPIGQNSTMNMFWSNTADALDINNDIGLQLRWRKDF